MKPNTQNPRVLGSYRAQTPLKKKEEAIAQATTPLAKVVPRMVKKPAFLGSARRARGADPSLILRDEQNRQDLASSPTEEHGVIDKKYSESSGNEATGDPNIIRIPDFLRTSDTAIDESLTGSESPLRDIEESLATGENPITANLDKKSSSNEVIGRTAVIETSDHLETPDNTSADNLTGSESSSGVHLSDNTASPVAEAGESSPGSLNLPKNRHPILSKRRAVADFTLDPAGSRLPRTPPRPSRKLAQILPPLRSPEKKTRSSKFKSPRMMINEAREINALKKAERAKRTNLQSIFDNLPRGMNLDDHGNLSGTSLITSLPKKYREGTMNFQPGKEGMNYQDFFNEKCEAALKGRTTNIGGSDFIMQAASDFYRTDYEFIDQRKVFRSADIESKNQEVRERTVARNLIDFAGADNAAFVLSSVLQQGLVTALMTSLSNHEGVALNSHLRPVNVKTTKGINRQVTLFKDDGTREVIQDPRGMGTAKFKLSRNENGDFKLLVDWQAYYDLQRDNVGENLVGGLPLGENDVIGVHFQAELMINKAEADKRQVQIATEGIWATFSGRLQIN